MLIRTLVASSLATAIVVSVGAAPARAASAQAPLPAQAPPPQISTGEIERILTPIALYPDPLLAQVLAASTFPEQIGDAAQWADRHHYLSGAALSGAMADDQVPWDPSVQALLPFPSVLGMMASDTAWTEELGNAFLADRDAVMDAVQRLRGRAREAGYLASNAQIRVSDGPDIRIQPIDPGFIVVPYYDPRVVFVRPRGGLVVAGAIRFGYGVTIGAVFAPWGWGSTEFDWGRHLVIIDRAPWGREWANRRTYVHPYALPRRDAVRRDAGRAPVRPPERHEAIARSPRERANEREGRAPSEEHKGAGRGKATPRRKPGGDV